MSGPVPSSDCRSEPPSAANQLSELDGKTGVGIKRQNLMSGDNCRPPGPPASLLLCSREKTGKKPLDKQHGIIEAAGSRGRDHQSLRDRASRGRSAAAICSTL